MLNCYSVLTCIPRLASMDFRQLRTFSCVAELGSLSKASDTLRVAQPALSRQIKLLEHELRAELFTRRDWMAVAPEAGGDTDSRKPRSVVDALQLAPKVRDAFDVGYFGDRAQACTGGNHIKPGPQSGLADLHPGLAKMAVVENNDRKICRLLRCN